MRKLLLALIFIAFSCSFALPVFAQSNQVLSNGGASTPVSFGGSGCTYYWVNSNPAIGLAASGVSNISSFTATNNSNSPITATITATPIPADLAYIANSNGNVSVINTITNSLATQIQVGQQPWGVSSSQDGHKVYVSNSGSNTVSVINTSTNTVTATIPVGSSPHGIAVSPNGSRAYVANTGPSYFSTTGPNSVSVINTTINTVVATIPVGTDPVGVVVSPDGSRVYVVNVYSNTVSVINTATNSVIATIVAGAESWGITINPNGKFVYVACPGTNTVAIINTSTNLVVASVPVSGSPAGVSVSPDGSKLYVTNAASGNLTVINTTTNTVTDLVRVDSSPCGVSVSPDGKQVYVADYDSNDIAVIDATTNSRIATVPQGSSSYSMGNFVSLGPGCTRSPTTFTITVNPQSATITASPATGTISACVGTASASPNIQQFTVTGANPVSGITATAPAGFEVSLSATSGYSNSVIIYGPLAGSNTPITTTVYVRSAAGDAAGPISGNVVLSTSGAPNQTIFVSGNVNALPTVNTVANQVIAAGSSTTAINFTGTGNTYTWTNDSPGIGLAASGSGNIPAFTGINTGTIPIRATVTITPALDELAYITNNTDNTISVINTLTQKVVNSISVNNAPYGIAVSPDGLHVYISNNSNNTLTILSVATNTYNTINTVPAPIGVYVSPDNSKYYVASNVYGVVYVYNASNNTLITQLTVGNKPLGMTGSPDGSQLYVANSGDNTISVINTATNMVTGTFSTNNSPSWVAISPDGSKLYVTNSNSNNVSVINTANGNTLTTISVNNNPKTIAISSDGSRLYVVNQGSNNISVINTSGNTIITTIAVGQNPFGISITTDGSELYVANNGDKKVSVISTATNKVITTIDVGNNPSSFGNFISPPGCSGIPKTFTIIVNPAAIPTITTGRVTGDITGCEGTVPATPRQFTVSGTALTEGITANAPSNFEISLDPASGYSSSIFLPETNGIVNNTIIYVRTTVTAPAGSNYKDVEVTSNGALTQEVIVSYTIYTTPSVDAVINQTVINGNASSPISFSGTADTYNWVNNTPGIGLAASGTGNIPSFTGINNTNAPIIATITATPVNTAGCSGTPILFNITINPTAQPGTLTVAANLTPLTTIYGTPSQKESFTVSGTNVINDVLITSPAGFEVSNNNTTFAGTTTISGGVNPLNGSQTLLSIPVYIRLAATTPVGMYSGNIVLSTSNASDVNIFMPNSTVTPAPLTITANNITKPLNTANPRLTVNYSGFVNNDGPAQLTTQPFVSTTALTTSPVGQYPITVTDAASPNYTITYVSGILTIEPSLSAANIPNTFTPNGDGINDTWQINDLVFYSKCTVNIFDRWGQKVYTSIGYPTPWDGTYKGKVLPSGTYYYIIDPKNGQSVLSGWVEIVK